MAKRKQPNWRQYSSVGLEFAGIFGMFLAAGILLDRHAGSTPANTVVGTVIGFGAALYWLLRRAQEIRRGAREQQDRESDEEP